MRLILLISSYYFHTVKSLSDPEENKNVIQILVS